MVAYFYEEKEKTMGNCIDLLQNNSFIKIVLLVVVLDTILGVLRAIKERKFNSNFGINGAIRKIAMIVCIVTLVALDMLLHINIVAFVPDQILNVIGIKKAGLSEFFSILFVLYEAVSIMKNMVLCELPVPKRLQNTVEKFLVEMTEEVKK